MTKLSERIPRENPDYSVWADWLQELAEYVEYLEKQQLILISKSIEEPKSEYEPQTYDEAIALCKGWKRCVMDGFVHWETAKGAWWIIDPNDEVGFCEADYENYNFSWERDKWPDLWKEMIMEDCPGYLYFQEDKWILYFPSRHQDSTPGRVVCQAYLVYKGHPEWAERLSKHD